MKSVSRLWWIAASLALVAVGCTSSGSEESDSGESATATLVVTSPPTSAPLPDCEVEVADQT